jgi:hypothetical protein
MSPTFCRLIAISVNWKDSSNLAVFLPEQYVLSCRHSLSFPDIALSFFTIPGIIENI